MVLYSTMFGSLQFRLVCSYFRHTLHFPPKLTIVLAGNNVDLQFSSYFGRKTNPPCTPHPCTCAAHGHVQFLHSYLCFLSLHKSKKRSWICEGTRHPPLPPTPAVYLTFNDRVNLDDSPGTSAAHLQDSSTCQVVETVAPLGLPPSADATMIPKILAQCLQLPEEVRPATRKPLLRKPRPLLSSLLPATMRARP